MQKLMSVLLLVFVCVSSESTFAQPGGPLPLDGGSEEMSITYVKVTALTLAVTDLGNDVYEGDSSASFEAYCDTSTIGPLYITNSELKVKMQGGATDTISIPGWAPGNNNPNSLTVPPGATVSWTLDNANPGPAPTFVAGPNSDWMTANAIVAGFREVGDSPSPDADHKLVNLSDDD